MTAPSADDFNQLAQAYAICTTVLLVKYIFSVFYGSNSGNHPEEDSTAFNLPPVPADIKRRERQVFLLYNSLLMVKFIILIFL